VTKKKNKAKSRATLPDPWALMELVRPRIRMGPMLRHVSETTAVFWMELSTAARLTLQIYSRGVHAQSVKATSFRVGTRHYAMIAVEKLRPNTWYTYRILGAGAAAPSTILWPDPGLDKPLPPSTFKTFARDSITALRIAMVSCRLVRPLDDDGDDDAGVDALLLYARRLRKDIAQRNQKWPDLFLMTGDQIYADNPSPDLSAKINASRAGTNLPTGTLIGFEEFAQGYAEAWSLPDLRWMFSCIPTFMIFDDHEIIDDWNISSRWLTEMHNTNWWTQKYSAGLLAYWVYQGAGNLAPTEWARDERMRAMLPRSNIGYQDSTGSLGALFFKYALTPSAPRFSYVVDVGATRIVVGDLRYRRDLKKRLIMDDTEWDWFANTIRTTQQRNLLIVSSLPFLLPDAIHELETASETSNKFPWTLIPGSLVLEGAGKGPTYLRNKFDLEHWSAFSSSFNKMLDLMEEILTGAHAGPKFVGILSGDVHFSYNMQGRFTRAPLRPIYQLVSSGARNALTGSDAAAISLLASPIGSGGMALARGLAAGLGTGMLPVNPKAAAQRVRIKWEPTRDPSGWIWMGNFVATLTLSTGRAECIYETAHHVSGLNEDPAVTPYPNRRLLPRGKFKARIL